MGQKWTMERTLSKRNFHFIKSVCCSPKTVSSRKSQQVASGWDFDSFNRGCETNKGERGIKLSFLNLGSLEKANTAKMRNDLTPANSVEHFGGIQKYISRQKSTEHDWSCKFPSYWNPFLRVYIFKLWSCGVYDIEKPGHLFQLWLKRPGAQWRNGAETNQEVQVP